MRMDGGLLSKEVRSRSCWLFQGLSKWVARIGQESHEKGQMYARKPRAHCK